MESHATVVIPLDDRVLIISSLNCADFSRRLSEVAQTLDAISGIQFLGNTALAEWRRENAGSALPENYQTEPVWDCHETACFLCIHPATVKRLAREGKLPAFRIGNRWRFRPSELDAWARSAVPSSHSLRRE